ncbi:hypothetical protein K503DRAFT_772573 [Rhizopogon vinicolor AM-OR11-026]|uniref:CBM1 domain-containing protein n=1 Tax=Rhizopogon vinicolor AM-OR11-026 TaxID=1314800 RepID=A0A1B7MUW5_9AGAM|nr:hypothetical protein K503DRAFT_772573 [Rhizopogon vinicolor AM-OR11-026]
MRFSFIVAITALTASMSVSACGKFEDYCNNDIGCCSGFYCNSTPDLSYCLPTAA